MINNHVSAIRSHLILYELNHSAVNHPKITSFLKSLRINRPLSIPRKNIIDIPMLTRIINMCDMMSQGSVFKAAILLSFFGFLRLSNLCSTSYSAFDPTRHLTPTDVLFTSRYVKIILKWSKTIQSRNKAQVITLPRLKHSPLCPHRALKAIMSTSDQPHRPLLHLNTLEGFKPLIDSRMRKSMSYIIKKLGFPKSYVTFHSLRRSGATLAYNAHVPLADIKLHGSWASDCVWTYIQRDHRMGEKVADAFMSFLS